MLINNDSMPLDVTHPLIQHYAEMHTSPQQELLRQIDRDTQANVLMPRMLSGHLQGRFLAMISRMVQPNIILEIGTYTGYSALSLAEGLGSAGKLITIDINDELEERVRNYFNASKFAPQLDYRIGNALEIIPTIKEKFDLVFIDANKENNTAYFNLVFKHVNLGGFIIVDNVLWSGKVIEEKPDKDTRSIIDFNSKIQADKRVENVLLPLRDGLLLMQKIED
jgi:caffeoyl-CoA O-methyltransferase